MTAEAMGSADLARQRRVLELGTLIARHVPDEVLVGSADGFDRAFTALEEASRKHSTLGEVVRDALTYADAAEDDD